MHLDGAGSCRERANPRLDHFHNHAARSRLGTLLGGGSCQQFSAGCRRRLMLFTRALLQQMVELVSVLA